ncbi:MAG: DUF1800 family protein, partial [Thiobacillaceae bacterium]
WVKSDPVGSTGWYGFRVGTSPVTLSDKSSGLPLVGQTVTALEKLPSGTFRWDRQGVTDAQGRIRFDLPGLGKGAVYVLRAENPYGDGKAYFSPLISYRGPVAFVLDQQKTNAPDLVPPSVAIQFPTQADRVGPGGFQLQGTAVDDQAIKEVRLRLTLPGGGVLERQAVYRAESGTWLADSGPLGGTAGTLKVQVQAVDRGLNVAEAVLELSLVIDTTPPAIEILSHKEGDRVPTGGFLVTGRLTDDTLGPSLMARVTGGGLPAAEERGVEIAPASGRWALMLAPEAAYTTAPIDLTLMAKDAAGNTSTRTIRLRPSEDYRQAWHVLLRTGFGATPGQLQSVVDGGVQDHVWRQLHPDGVDDDGFEQRQADWPDAGGYLATDLLRHTVYSRRQLQELMTWFWDNHFNTYFYSHNRGEYERQERAAFLSHALGNFRDLLGISARSPAMLHTLDGVSNRKSGPNENYARELMELHTLGIDGGYSQQDVQAAARAFTGWTVKDGAFFFNAAQHDSAEKQVLGLTLPAGGGLDDGERVLDMLAKHPATARHVCTKLVTLFVSDTPVETLVQQCATVFLAQADAPDQIRQVLWTILNSSAFLGTEHRGRKVKTPLEFLVGAVRNLGVETDADDLVPELQRMGISPYANPVPTGYADKGEGWISSGLLLTRIRFLDRLLSVKPSGGASRVALLEQMQAAGLETAEGVVGRMLELALGPTATRGQLQTGLDLLTEKGGYAYLPWSPDAEARLRRLGKALLALPEYQYQ